MSYLYDDICSECGGMLKPSEELSGLCNRCRR